VVEAWPLALLWENFRLAIDEGKLVADTYKLMRSMQKISCCPPEMTKTYESNEGPSFSRYSER